MRRNSVLYLVGGVLLFMSLKAYSAPKQADAFRELFKFVEDNEGLPPNLLLRLAQQESMFNPLATNPSGAQGMMQIIPRWHPGVDPFDPAQAIPYAGKFLAAQYARFGSWRAALAAYNWGPGNVSKALRRHSGDINALLADVSVPVETRNYVAQITADVTVV